MANEKIYPLDISEFAPPGRNQQEAKVAMNYGQGMQNTAIPRVTPPNDPRLHAINNTVCRYVETIHTYAQSLNLKADAIVGARAVGKGKGTTAPSPVPNGAIEQIEMALASLGRAIEDLSEAENRFAGLA